MALHYMYQARKILDEQLHSREVSEELANGVEMLANALQFAENPDSTIHVCPRCDSVYFEEISNGHLQCLGCDQILLQNNREEASHGK